MKLKRGLAKIGCGIKKNPRKPKKHVTLNTIIKNAKTAIKKSRPDSLESAVKAAIKSIKKSKKNKQIKSPRIIKVPNTYSGGVLPLIPIFAGLSALGSMVGSTASIVKAINNYKDAQRQLEENKRHNKTMEAIAIGNGYYLNQQKRGDGYYLHNRIGASLNRNKKNKHPKNI